MGVSRCQLVSVIVVVILAILVRPWMGLKHSAHWYNAPKPTIPPGMKPDEIEFVQNAQGLWLFTKVWMPHALSANPAFKPKGIVFLIHGFGEYITRPTYQAVADRLASEGFLVCGHDHVGHGYSFGDRIYTETFEVYVHDMILVHEHMLARFERSYGRLPRFVFGHSLGSLITLTTVLGNQKLYDFMMLSGTALLFQPPGDMLASSPVLRAICEGLSLVIPHVPFAFVPPENLSHNKQAVARYVNDPLVYLGGGPLRTSIRMLIAAMNAATNAVNVTIPFVLFHGTDDPITLPESSKILYENSRSPDKTLHTYEGGLHELFEEDTHGIRDRFQNDLVAWVLKHTSGSNVPTKDSPQMPPKPIPAPAATPIAPKPIEKVAGVP